MPVLQTDGSPLPSLVGHTSVEGWRFEVLWFWGWYVVFEGSGLKVWGVRVGISGSVFIIYRSGLTIQGFLFGGWGSRDRVQGSGFGALGLGFGFTV